MNLDWVNIALAPMKPDDKFELLRSVWRSQQGSAVVNTDNVSNFVAGNVGAGSMSLPNSLAAAILSTGGLHAPVTQARRVIFHQNPCYIHGVIVPGFGNSFYKDIVDPVWQGTLGLIIQKYESHYLRIMAWSDALRAAGKAHLPNAASITAAAAEIVGWPEGLEPLLVIEPRLEIWAKLHAERQPKKRMLS